MSDSRALAGEAGRVWGWDVRFGIWSQGACPGVVELESLPRNPDLE